VIIDTRGGAVHSDIDCDLCIVGGGAAGLTIARELADTRLSICLLEGVGLRMEPRAQSLLAGEMAESPYPPLHTVRVSALGGTMYVWAGWCRPLDPIDFEARAAVPHSGWPFGFDELLPHYERAHALLGLGPFDYDASAWERASGGARLPLDERGFSSILFRRAPVNFGASMRALFTQSDRLQLLLHLHALRLRFSPDGQSVAAAEAATLNGRRCEVRARAFVVAAGGIETARLLLLSAGASGGPADPHGVVGRYFMEHGCDSGRVFVPGESRATLRFYDALRSPAGRDGLVARGERGNAAKGKPAELRHEPSASARGRRRVRGPSRARQSRVLGDAPPASRTRPPLAQGGLRAERTACSVTRDVAARLAARDGGREAPGALPVRMRARCGQSSRARERP